MKKEKMSPHHRKILLTVMLASFLTPFNGSAMNMSLPDLQNEFQVATSSLSWVISLFLMTCAVFLLPAGQLSNSLGKRRLFLWGTALFTLSSILTQFASTFTLLLLFRTVQGVASAILFTTSMSIVALAFPPRERGRAFGLVVSVVYAGLALGPVIGGFLNYQFGWRSIFWFTAAVGLASWLMTVFVMKEEWVSDPDSRLDVTGALLCGLSLVLVMLGLSEINRFEPAKWILLAGVVTTAVFVVNQYGKAKPLLPVRIFMENRTFTLSNLAAMLNYAATFAVGFLMSLYFQKVDGMNSQEAGLFMLVTTVIMTFLSPAMGALSDRVNPRILASSGMALIAVALFAMIHGIETDSRVQIVFCLALLGVGFALFSAPNNNSVMSSVPKHYVSLASSVINLVRLIGQVLSMAVVAYILSRHVPEALSETHTLTTNIEIALAAFGVICLVGVVPSYVRGNVRHAHDAPAPVAAQGKED